MWNSAKYIEKSENLNNNKSFDDVLENEKDEVIADNDDFEE